MRKKHTTPQFSKCAVGNSCTSLHSPDNPQATLPCDYLPLSPNPPAKPHSSISDRPTDAFGAESSRPIGLNMKVKHGRDNNPLLYSKQPGPCESPRFPSRIQKKKDVPTLQHKLIEADKMERVRAETRARISKAIKVRDDLLSLKQQADDDNAERVMAFPRKEGPSTMTTESKEKEWTPPQLWALHWERNNPLSHKQQVDGDAERAMTLPKSEGPSMMTTESKKNEWSAAQPWALDWERNNPLSHKQLANGDLERAMALPRREGPSMMTTESMKKEWSPPQPWGLNWDRTKPLTCPMKLPWNEHCLCYECVSTERWRAEVFAPGALLAKPAISGPKEPWRMDKKAVDAPSAKPTKVLDTEGNRAGSVIKREVTTPEWNEAIKPGLKNPMHHAPTAHNSADSLPKLTRVAANPSPAAQQAKQEEIELRIAVSGKDARPSTDHSSKEGLLAGGRVGDAMCAERRKEVLRKMAREAQESMKHERWFQYRSIHKSDLQKLKDELKESDDKLAIIKEVMEQDQQGLTNLLDALRRGKGKTCTQQDEKEHEGINKDAAVPTSSKKVNPQAPLPTTPNPQQSTERDGKTSQPPLTQSQHKLPPPKPKHTQPRPLAPTLLLAFSILDLTLRITMLVTFWLCSPSAWYPSSTIQTTIVWLTPATMLLGCWRAWYELTLSGRGGGSESERILGLVETMGRAALGVAGLLVVSAVVGMGLFRK